MYHPQVVQQSQDRIEARFGFPLERTPVADAIQRAEALALLLDPDSGQLSRPLTEDEQRFVVQEQLLYQIDFRYACERYLKINAGGKTLMTISPFWVSQEMVLSAIAQRELEQNPLGGLVCTLKARQLGVSTLAEALIVHACTAQPYRRALIASDATDTSGHLFGMAEIMYRHLPWYLKPASTKYVTSGEKRTIALENESSWVMASGASMRGQKVEDSGEGKGEIGRGMTTSALHLSELASWSFPEQIDDALFPTIPLQPYVVGVLESTAKGRYNWWHKQWLKSEQGLGRFAPVFIPWYAEPTKYRLPPPPDWAPSSDSLAHAKACFEESPRWMGHAVTLAREQLYWYERERSAWTQDDRLADFLSEYPATPAECFQYSGRSIFSLAVRERIKSQARPIAAVMLVEPHALAQERALLVQQGKVPSA